jgi:predicted acetyltransferase
MKVNHYQRKNRPEHIFELIRKIYPELHRKMFEAIDRQDEVYQKTLEDIAKLKKGKW